MSRNNRAANGAPDVVLNGSDTLPAQVELAEGRSISLGNLVAHAHTASGLSADDWNKLDAGKRDELLQASIDALKAGAGNNPAASDPPAPKAGKKIKVRVLVAGQIEGEHRQPNDVITVDAETLKGHAGALDADPAAVKYAESLKDSAED